jgi:hemerythrin superfamily protein
MPKTEVRNAIELLRSDHEKVKGLFAQFEKARDFRSKKKFAQGAITELKVHAKVEEEVFYPAVRKEIDDKFVMNEANEEHHVAKVLIAELDNIEGNNEGFEAKFTVLAENVRHHIKEEEGTMFPKVKKAHVDLDSLGMKMSQRKEELMAHGVPPTEEEDMVKSALSDRGSPAEVGAEPGERSRSMVSEGRPGSKNGPNEKGEIPHE